MFSLCRPGDCERTRYHWFGQTQCEDAVRRDLNSLNSSASRTACYPVEKRRGVPDPVGVWLLSTAVQSPSGRAAGRLWIALSLRDRSMPVRRRFKELAVSSARRPACSFFVLYVTTVDLPSASSTLQSSSLCVFER